jgi:UDP:flavonoid glycosyltransferase YjiC (YdhE family)
VVTGLHEQPQVREVGTVLAAVRQVARDIWQRLTSRSRRDFDPESAKAERARWVEEAARAADLDGVQRRTLPPFTGGS